MWFVGTVVSFMTTVKRKIFGKEIAMWVEMVITSSTNSNDALESTPITSLPTFVDTIADKISMRVPSSTFWATTFSSSPRG